MFDYLAILIYLIVAAGFAIIFSGAAFLVAFRRLNSEKTAQYECGFDPFDDARSKFDVRFYLVALLFLVMDLEVRPDNCMNYLRLSVTMRVSEKHTLHALRIAYPI